MALPAGRYGVTKNQLLKIKKLPMNTIKLIEELTEKFDLLGTAAFKNSTSVVTDSTDLVESGAVKDIVGWGNKNLFNPELIKGIDVNLVYTPYYIGDGTFTCSSNMPLNTGGGANLFILAGNVQTGASTSENGVYVNNPRTVTSISGYITIVSRFENINPRNYNNQLEKGSTATSYEPYHAPVLDTLRDAEVVEGKNLFSGFESDFTGQHVIATVNADKTVTVTNDGSSASANTFIEQNVNYTFPYPVILSGCPSNGSDSLYRLDANGTYADYGEGVTIPANTNITKIRIRIASGYKPTNLVFKPMISVSGGSYEPYYVPLKDVVPTKADNSVIGTVEDGTNPTKSYAVGEHMIRGGKFCTVTVGVTTSSTWTLGSNYIEGDVASELFSNKGNVYTGSYNDYTTDGIYFVSASLTNLPEANVDNCVLIVKGKSDGSIIMQTVFRATASSGSAMYIRRYANNAWSSWYKYEGTIIS